MSEMNPEQQVDVHWVQKPKEPEKEKPSMPTCIKCGKPTKSHKVEGGYMCHVCYLGEEADDEIYCSDSSKEKEQKDPKQELENLQAR